LTRRSQVVAVSPLSAERRPRSAGGGQDEGHHDHRVGQEHDDAAHRLVFQYTTDNPHMITRTCTLQARTAAPVLARGGLHAGVENWHGRLPRDIICLHPRTSQMSVVRGFHWESPPFVWVRNQVHATKYPSARIAAQVAIEVGAAPVQVAVTAYRPRG
jgi:hypothetical protein